MTAALSHPGTLVLVVGSSGVGKDTLLTFARAALAGDDRFRFVRRVITRPAGGGEDHERVSPEEFATREANGAFALHWDAHGLRYGLPADVDGWLDKGFVVIANGSRAAMSAAGRKYPDLRIIEITAAAEVIAARLASRRRESAADIAERLSRGAQFGTGGQDMLRIDNSGAAEIGGTALVSALLAFRDKPSPAGTGASRSRHAAGKE